MGLQLTILFARDLPRMAEFYRDVLGLKPVSRSEGWVEFDGFALHAAAVTPAKVREEAAFKPVFTADVSRLEEHRVPILRRPWGGCDGVDPEGNVFGIRAAEERWQAMAPMIHVPDVRATVEWYASIGFRVKEIYEDCGEMTWASLAYGDSEVMLNAGGQASDAERREVDLYIRTGEVEALYQKLKGRVEMVADLYDAFHGMREFIIRDCNRFWITFGQAISGR